MSTKIAPRYIPSEAVTTHPFYDGSYLKSDCRRSPDGGASAETVRDYLRINLKEVYRFDTAAFYTAVQWDIRRWARENGVEL